MRSLLPLLLFLALPTVRPAAAAEPAPGSSDLVRAYSYYLLQEYDAAKSLYMAANRADPDNMDAYYGLMNCSIAQGEFDDAIATGTRALQRRKDGIIYAKMGYCYARKNDSRNAELMYSLATAALEDTTRQDRRSEVITALGWGFYENGNYGKALRWFEKGDSLFGEPFTRPRELAASAHANAFIAMLNGSGGPVFYSDKSTYRNGEFYSLEGSFLVNRRLHYTAAYAHTGIRYKTLQYGITYDDTLIASSGKHPDVDKPHVAIPTINLDGDPDTIFHHYHGQLLDNGESDTTGYDWVSTMRPGNLWQDDFHLSATLYQKSTALSGGARFTLSNIANSDRAATVYLSHLSSPVPFSVGSEYYVTKLGSGWIYQISPLLLLESGFLTTSLTLHATRARVEEFAGEIREWQFALDIAETFSLKTVKATLSLALGDRVFLNESAGGFLNNVTAPHALGVRGVVEWTPWRLPFTLYYLIKFTRYGESTLDRVAYPGYDALVNMGGVFFQW